MCFLTVLLLLLISTFTYSMNTLVQTAPQEETLDEHERELQDRGIQSDPVMDNLIPFIHPYTDETKKFLKRMTRQFYITIPGKLKLVISCLKSSLKPKDDCKFNFEMNYINYEGILTRFKSIRIIFTANDK